MSCGDGGDMISRWGWQFAERWGGVDVNMRGAGVIQKMVRKEEYPESKNCTSS